MGILAKLFALFWGWADYGPKDSTSFSMAHRGTSGKSFLSSFKSSSATTL
jgi:hypothetical protein